MVQLKKCQSKKHDKGGCGDPKCPEGASLQAAKDEAIRNNDFNGYTDIRDIEESKAATGQMKNWFKETFSSKRRRTEPNQRILEGIQRVSDIDKTNIPSFKNVHELGKHLNSLYSPYASVIFCIVPNESESGLKALSVEDMHVADGMRSLGIGRHMRATINRFADENGYVIMGTPTPDGDGTVKVTSRKFAAHALAHRQRLEKFYLDTGYEYNYAYDYAGLRAPDFQERDELSGEPYPSNPDWVGQFNWQALSILRYAGSYVRFPNGEIPEKWKA